MGANHGACFGTELSLTDHATIISKLPAHYTDGEIGDATPYHGLLELCEAKFKWPVVS
jgi:hypothetical protein